MSAAILPINDAGGWTRERLDLIKKTICPTGITDAEFALFVEKCKRSEMDPLVGECFCVPRRKNIGSKEAPRWVVLHEFQAAESGMLSRAERFPDYRGTQAAAVFSKDVAEIDAPNGSVAHKFRPGDRGLILGAWARVEREGRTPTVVWVDFIEVVQTSPTWSKMSPTMIAKCARVAALRKAYPAAFSNCYIPEEMPDPDGPEGGGEKDVTPAPAEKAEAIRAALNGAPQGLPAPSPIKQSLIVDESTVPDAVLREAQRPIPQEPPPLTDQDAPGGEPPPDMILPGQTSDPMAGMVRIGKNKGRVRLADVEMSELIGMADWLVNKGKATASNKTALAEIEAEMQQRKG